MAQFKLGLKDKKHETKDVKAWLRHCEKMLEPEVAKTQERFMFFGSVSIKNA